MSDAPASRFRVQLVTEGLVRRRAGNGWRPTEGPEATTLEGELRRELPVGHALYGRDVRAVARRDDRDDVAFEVADTGLCVVHLTWQRETDPRWPRTVFVDALTDEDDA